MNTHELPMIIFTILAQMSVGAFVVLGVIQVVAARRHGPGAVDTVTDPALYAIGPVLVAGLVASMFHMHDLTNTFNVVRHLGSSWLSAEIVSGVAFAGLGFVFAAAQWFRWATPTARRILAAVTAVVGLALIGAMSSIYYTLVTVPAWHTWTTPAQFLTTTLLLGTLAVGAALTTTVLWRGRRTHPTPRTTGDTRDSADPAATALLTTTLTGIGIAAITLLGIEFLIIPLHITTLATAGSPAATTSAAVYTGAWFITRLALVFTGAGLLATFLIRATRTTTTRPTASPRILATLATTAFILVLASELIGRSLFYDSMTRIGM